MKIGLMISSLTMGGAERVMTNLADYFTKQGHEVVLVTQYKREKEYALNPSVRRVMSEITEEEKANSRIGNFYRRFMKLRNIWKKENPDVILSFIGKNNFMNILTTRGLKIPVLVSMRAQFELEYYNRFMKMAAKCIYPMADGLILQAESTKKDFPKVVQKKSVVLKNPINDSFFRPEYTGERNKTIVSVGALYDIKNQIMIIEAFAKIAEKYPEYQVVFYGEGPLREEWQKRIDELGLTDRILMPGRTDNVAEQIEKASVYVLSSLCEGAPNTLIEAMLLGLPVIATDCPVGVPRDLITENENGMLVPVNDVDALAKKMDMLLSDEELRKQMGQNARKLGESYQPDKVYAEWENYLIEKAKKQ